MKNDTVVGYSKNGQEVARMSAEELKYVRPAKHYNSI